MTLQRKRQIGERIRQTIHRTVCVKLAASNAACHCDLCLLGEVKSNLEMKDLATQKNNSKPGERQRP